MSEVNKSYRIRTNVNADEQFINVDFTQNYDKFEILSLEINQSNSYRLMNSNTGIVVGRVLANEGFGIPNAKVSVFVKYDNNDELNSKLQYQYSSTLSNNDDGIRYNLLPDKTDEQCKQSVGTFPSKRYVLDNDDVIEVFDKYYRYTTKTNNSGDYMIYGVPTGQQTIHCDIDLSDIGVLSQTPRDMIYKGYNLNLFDSPSKFKSSTDLNSLAQIKSQDTPLFVYSFWGDTSDNPTGAAITRCDINISYKFEPTCVFIGSVITDTNQNAVSKKCIPSKVGGKMSEMATGSGKIEMIRKTVNGDVEQIAIKGNEVIDEDGVWCYQIPMNLDYVMTDEYGNTVLSDNPSKGIPTRTRVRFRVSMHENPADGVARKRARYLIPNNPHITSDYPDFTKTKDIDYEFGSKTKDENFRDLMWNNVYTVKNYIPRLQKARLPNNLKFLGIKMTNHSGKNNPMPFNKLSIKFNFTYTFMCVLIKTLIQLTRFINIILNAFQWMLLSLAHAMVAISNIRILGTGFTPLAGIGGKTPDQGEIIQEVDWTFDSEDNDDSTSVFYGCSDSDKITKDSLDDDKYPVGYEGFPGYDENRNKNRAAWHAVAYMLWAICEQHEKSSYGKWRILKLMKRAKVQGLAAFCCGFVLALGRGIVLDGLCDNEDGIPISVAPGPDRENSNFLQFVDGNVKCLTMYNTLAELYNCVENQLAQENEVTSFNFFNDWVNGTLYMPLWFRKIKPKRRFLGFDINSKDRWCNGDIKARGVRKLKLYSNCVIKRDVNVDILKPLDDDYETVNVEKSKANDETGREDLEFTYYGEKNCYGYKCHKYGRSETPVISGIIIEKETMLKEHVYYYKPAYFNIKYNKDLVTLFATDIVLLGSLSNCDLHGIPQFFKILEGTSYQMPPDLLSEDYEYSSIADSNSTMNTDENEQSLIDESTRMTEYTGADWGNLGVDQSNYKNGKFEANENIYDNGGLFYGITCFDSYTKPKSIINLERICEIGVSLDESQDIIKDRSLPIEDENSYTTLTPDGYISYDDIYNPDYRSMFATLNSNSLKTKLNYETGLTEYDLTHLYLDNFDGSLSEIMKGGATQGNVIVNGVDTREKANYVNNHKLEVADKNYTSFRFGKKLYFYEYKKMMSYIVSLKNPIYSDKKIPRYENSFYFYFGLTSGKTAIDKFYTNFYADCGIEENYGKAIEIDFKGNEWCSNQGGYITFKCRYELPLSLKLTDKKNPKNVYTSDDSINSNYFYVGSKLSDDRSFENIDVIDKCTFVNLVDNTSSEINTLQHGEYLIEIVDGNGDAHTDSINFENTNKISFDLEKYDFNVSNAQLDTDDRFNTGETKYASIANYGKHVDNTDSNEPLLKPAFKPIITPIIGFDKIETEENTISRDIYGYLILSNISEDNYRIEVTPTDNSIIPKGIGYKCTKKAGEDPEYDINCVGNLYHQKNNDNYIYYIGLPYGNITYRVTVTMLCENGEDNETSNSTTTYVTVYEGSLNMYINGIDYELIKNFNTGWTIGDDVTSEFNADNIKGWNKIDKIGVNPALYPVEIKKNETLDEFSKNLNEISDELNSIETGKKEYRSDYSWFGEYVINTVEYDKLKNEYDSLSSDEAKQENLESRIKIINNVLSNRIELTKQMIGSFRPNANGALEIVITGATKAKPIKYMIYKGTKKTSGKFLTQVQQKSN